MFSKSSLLIPILLAALLSTQPHAYANNTVQLAFSQNTLPRKILHKPMPGPPLGLAWGENYSTVKKVLTDKGFNNAAPNDVMNTVVLFSTRNAKGGPGNGVTIDGEKIHHIWGTVGPKGFVSIMMYYDTHPSDKDTLAQFHRLAKKLITSYGPPGQAVESVAPPYKIGDEVAAIKNNKGEVHNNWYFAPRDQTAPSGTISIRISEQSQVAILYLNQTLAK